MKNLLLLILCLFVFNGCYEIAYRAQIQIQAKFENDLYENEKVTEMCADVAYKLTTNGSGQVYSEKKCELSPTLENGILTASFELALEQKADSYDLLNVQNITLKTTAYTPSNCEDCAVTMHTRTYRAEMQQFRDAESPLQVELQFSLVNEHNKVAWKSALKDIIEGCRFFSSNVTQRTSCLNWNIRPELARSCYLHTTTHSERMNCLNAARGR